MKFSESIEKERKFRKNIARFFPGEEGQIKFNETEGNDGGVDFWYKGMPVDFKLCDETPKFKNRDIFIEKSQKNGTTWMDGNPETIIMYILARYGKWYNYSIRLGDLQKFMETPESREYVSYPTDTGGEGFYLRTEDVQKFLNPKRVNIGLESIPYFKV